MKLKTLINREERAVSPVIGVILMVAITVILAAVIGAFVLGIGGDMATTPSASVTITDLDDTNNLTTIEHRGGDTLASGEWEVQVQVNGENQLSDAQEVGEDFSTGDQLEIGPGGSDVDTGSGSIDFSSGDDVRVLIIDQESGEIVAKPEMRA